MNICPKDHLGPITMRPRARYHIGFYMKVRIFRPVGVKPARPGRVCPTTYLAQEEAEALRLKHVKGLEQIEAAKCMGISQSTFQRILASAHHKVADALISGKSIEIRRAQ